MARFFTKEERSIYYIAKAIAEEFDYQINFKLAEKNEKASHNEMWSVSDTIVSFNLKYQRIEIETLYFNEFDEEKTKYVFFESFTDRDCRNVKDFSKVIGMYFEYFFKDFECSFTVIEY